ncbi:type IV toxin-antitoxin system AbiEi family antitoxin domain-containing protein [Microlunatus sagamiharensis]|uniref:type IV toxin-antitoxin system AbiEi family antitoxin domain-containing protein n=1 Tax=Microlunatus sagamiharensis TaxID=546874 RepID=UPI0012FE4E4A|nr:type IV toxin-antitoxin system AbiEi family antitoxin domain-containing protein [Microlunatus sagamiharensis]
MENALVRQHLLRQAGTVSRAQAREAGLSDREIAGLLARQEWIREHPGVFRLHAAVPLVETGLWAARLWLGPDVLLADETAAWWWGVLEDPPIRWSFVGPTRCRSTDRVQLSAAFVDPQDRWRHRSLLTMSRPLAVLRTSALIERRRAGAGVALIDRAKQTRAVRQIDLERALARHPGCWGSSTMRTCWPARAAALIPSSSGWLSRCSGTPASLVSSRTSSSG